MPPSWKLHLTAFWLAFVCVCLVALAVGWNATSVLTDEPTSYLLYETAFLGLLVVLGAFLVLASHRSEELPPGPEMAPHEHGPQFGEDPEQMVCGLPFRSCITRAMGLVDGTSRKRCTWSGITSRARTRWSSFRAMHSIRMRRHRAMFSRESPAPVLGHQNYMVGRLSIAVAIAA